MPRICNRTFNSLNPTYNACVGDNGGFYMYAYVKGYKESVEILLERVLQERILLDSLVYPIIYNARHYVELALKSNIENLRNINKILECEDCCLNLKTHRISDLWQTVKKLSFVEIRYKEVIEKLEKYVLDYPDIDDSAETFRFPEDHDGKFHLQNQGCINLEDFAKRFAEMSEEFELLSTIDELLVNEYRVGTVVGKCSREVIKSIAKELPAKPWNSDSFSLSKTAIMKKYDLSSNQFSKVVKKIESHREFASYIGMELPIEELDSDRLALFISECKMFQSKGENSDPEIFWKNVNVMAEKFSLNEVATLAALREVGGYDGYYSEDFDYVLKKRLNEDVSTMLGFELLNSGRTLEWIQMGLVMTGQKSLLDIFE